MHRDPLGSGPEAAQLTAHLEYQRETARHTGQADLLREATDGTVGE